MSTRARSNNNNRKKKSATNNKKLTQDMNMTRVRQLIMPSYPSEQNNISLIPGDFNRQVIQRLISYNTIGNKKIKIRQTYPAGPLVQGAAINNGTIIFSAGATSDFSGLATVFDQYRIIGASCAFTPQANISTSQVGLGTSQINPRLYTCLDYDDAAGVTVNGITQYDSCVITPPNCGVVRTLLPRLAVASYSGAFSSYANLSGTTWIDVNSPNVQFYGVKYVVDAAATGQTLFQAYDVDVTLYMEFRAIR
jgi:hypothetical protein